MLACLASESVAGRQETRIQDTRNKQDTITNDQITKQKNYKFDYWLLSRKARFGFARENWSLKINLI